MASKKKEPCKGDHRCQTCGDVFGCLNTPVKCEIDKAAKVNKQGPFCALCFHVEMARRHAANRGIVLIVNWPPEGSAATVPEKRPVYKSMPLGVDR